MKNENSSLSHSRMGEKTKNPTLISRFKLASRSKSQCTLYSCVTDYAKEASELCSDMYMYVYNFELTPTRTKHVMLCWKSAHSVRFGGWGKWIFERRPMKWVQYFIQLTFLKVIVISHSSRWQCPHAYIDLRTRSGNHVSHATPCQKQSLFQEITAVFTLRVL